MTMDVARRAPASGARFAVQLSTTAIMTMGGAAVPPVSIALVAGEVRGLMLQAPEQGLLIARRVSGFDAAGERHVDIDGESIGVGALAARRAGLVVWGDVPGPLERDVPPVPLRVLVIAADGLRGGAGGAALWRDIRSRTAGGAAVLFLSADVSVVLDRCDSISEL